MHLNINSGMLCTKLVSFTANAINFFHCRRNIKSKLQELNYSELAISDVMDDISGGTIGIGQQCI